MLEVFIGLGIAVKREGKFYFYNMLTPWGLVLEDDEGILCGEDFVLVHEGDVDSVVGNDRRADKGFAHINSLNIHGEK